MNSLSPQFQASDGPSLSRQRCPIIWLSVTRHERVLARARRQRGRDLFFVISPPNILQTTKPLPRTLVRGVRPLPDHDYLEWFSMVHVMLFINAKLNIVSVVSPNPVDVNSGVFCGVASHANSLTGGCFNIGRFGGNDCRFCNGNVQWGQLFRNAVDSAVICMNASYALLSTVTPRHSDSAFSGHQARG